MASNRMLVLLARAVIFAAILSVFSGCGDPPPAAPTRPSVPAKVDRTPPAKMYIYRGRTIVHWLDRLMDPGAKRLDIEKAYYAVRVEGPRNPTVRGTLVEMLRSGDAEQRFRAGRALSLVGTPAVPDVIPLFGEEDPVVRRAAVQALGEMREKARAGAPALSKLLLDADPGVRQAAAAALGRINSRDPATSAGLAAALNDRDADVRAAAQWALEQINGE